MKRHNKKHGNVSKCGKLWINSIEEEQGRNIEQNKCIGRYNVANKNDCQKCYQLEDINLLTRDTMNNLQEKIARKETALQQMGYKFK